MSRPATGTSRARTFDGYKSHVGVDPDDELITNVAVTAANTADREVIDELLTGPGASAATGEPATGAGAGADDDTDTAGAGSDTDETAADGGDDSKGGLESKGLEVYGDSAYADGATLDEQTA